MPLKKSELCEFPTKSKKAPSSIFPLEHRAIFGAGKVLDNEGLGQSSLQPKGSSAFSGRRAFLGLKKGVKPVGFRGFQGSV